jgi:hypothetical protein
MGQAVEHVGEGGRIIAFSSSVMARSFPGYGPYIASRHALRPRPRTAYFGFGA